MSDFSCGTCSENKIIYYDETEKTITAIKDENGNVNIRIGKSDKVGDACIRFFALIAAMIGLFAFKAIFIRNLINQGKLPAFMYMLPVFVIIAGIIWCSLKKKGKSLRNNTAAAVVLEAYNKLNRVPDMDDLKQFLRDGYCDYNIFSTMIIAQLIGFAFFCKGKIVPEWILVLSGIAFLNVPLFDPLGRWLQKLLDAEPTDENYKLAIEAIKAVEAVEEYEKGIISPGYDFKDIEENN